VVWGGEGTNGQHAYHQMLHQGTRAVAVEFVLVADPDHPRAEHHRWLLANGLAQGEALLVGRAHADPQRAMPGNRPSTTVLLDALTPASLGALLALHEHRVFVQGILWGINSFDQWGVELGKTLAERLYAELAGADAAAQAPAAGSHDASTAALLRRLRMAGRLHGAG
jgi:glucose-6-phosphate isomerase